MTESAAQMGPAGGGGVLCVVRGVRCVVCGVWCVVCGVWYCSDIAGGCFVLATRTDLSLTRRGGFEQGHALGLALFLCQVQGRLAVLKMRRGRGRRREVRTVRG